MRFTQSPQSPHSPHRRRDLFEPFALILCDPVYFGGTTDKSLGSQSITDAVAAAGRNAEYIPTCEDCGNRIVELARPGDRIVIVGARDETLSGFAADVLARLVKASV